jgi:signal peptide peptidase SppA
MKYEHIVAEVFRKPWAILPEKLHVIAQLVALRASGARLGEAEIRARLEEAALAAGPRNAQQSFGAVALIPIRGVITRRANLMSQFSGGTSVEKLTAQFRSAVADSGVKAILFDVDSPGGTVEGIPELAEEIYKSRSQKKSVAIANGIAASAAYWLASAAGEMVVIPSGLVGSIGVFTEHEDFSKALEQAGIKTTLIFAGKFKVDGNDIEPLSESARKDMQGKVDAFYTMFVKSVARGRRVSQDEVRAGFGQGHMVLAADALKEGMVDRVATMDETLARLGVNEANPPRMAAASGDAEVRADIGDDDPLDEQDCGCMCGNCAAENCEACSNEACADGACAASGCPMQEQAKAKASALDIERRRRELDLL